MTDDTQPGGADKRSSGAEVEADDSTTAETDSSTDDDSESTSAADDTADSATDATDDSTTAETDSSNVDDSESTSAADDTADSATDDTADSATDNTADSATEDPTPVDAAATGESASTKELAAQLTKLRAEYTVLQRQLDAQTKQQHQRKRNLRPSKKWVSIAFVVLGGLLLPLTVLVRWTSNTVLDTDSYVETVAPLAENEDIQEALSYRISVILLDAIDFRELAKDALPTRAGFLAAPIESGVRVVVQDVVDELVSTQEFERLWEDVNRIGHENVVAILTGEGTDTLDAADGKVVVRLGPITEEVLNRLDEILGTNLKNSVPDERLDGEFVLVDSEELANVQDEISLFDRLSWLIPILTIALLAASVIISRPRRLAFRRLGFAIVVPMAVSLLGYEWLRSQYLGALPDDTHNPDAAAAFFDITTRFVPRDMRVLLVVGIVILFLTWLFGPTGWAGRARAWWDTLVGQVGDSTEGRDVGAAPRWVADNERTLLVFAFTLGVLALLAWTRPTGLVVAVVIVVVALVMGATSLLAEVGRRAIAADAKRDAASAPGGNSGESESADGALGSLGSERAETG